MLPRMSHHHGHHHAHDAEAEFNEFYSQRPQTWSGNPNDALVAEATGLTPGRALDVGCGEGADAVWLARQGWDVTALDPSGVALERARASAEAAGETVAFVHGDLVAARLPAASFDLVSCFYVRLPKAPESIPALLQLVARGGLLLVVHHAEIDRAWAAERGIDLDAFYFPDDIAAALDGAWTIEKREVRPRAISGGEGAHLHDDLVLRARRH